MTVARGKKRVLAPDRIRLFGPIGCCLNILVCSPAWISRPSPLAPKFKSGRVIDLVRVCLFLADLSLVLDAPCVLRQCV